MAYHIVGKLKGGKVFASKPHLTKTQAEKEHERLKKAGLQDSSVVPLNFNEDAAVNCAGGGAIAGIGIGPSGEPGVKRKKKSKVVISDILKRWMPNIRT